MKQITAEEFVRKYSPASEMTLPGESLIGACDLRDNSVVMFLVGSKGKFKTVEEAEAAFESILPAEDDWEEGGDGEPVSVRIPARRAYNLTGAEFATF